MIASLSFTALFMAFGCLAVRDLRDGEIGLVVANLRRSENPVAFRAVVTIEIICSILFGLVALATFGAPAEYDGDGVGKITLQMDES